MKGQRALRVAATALVAVLLLQLPLSLSLQAAPSSSAAAEEETVRISASSITVSGDAEQTAHAGKDGVYHIHGNADLHSEFTLEQAGKYRLLVNYCLDDSNKRKIEMTVKVNGQLTDATKMLCRVFEDEFAVDGEIRPAQLQVTDWLSEEVRSDDYRRGEYLYLDLNAGTNTIDLHFEDQILWISEMSLVAGVNRDLKTGAADGAQLPTIELEAEHAYRKSESSLPPTYDMANAVVSPYQYDKTLLNTIGGGSWSTSGQWIEWKIPVEESGYYRISLRVRQNTSRGLNSHRRISIDGAIPFESWDAYGFASDRDWYVETLKNDEGQDAYLWLEEGAHILRMEAVMGQALSSYQLVSDIVEQLNTIYRRIVMITGATPDANRSYQLFKRLPIREELREIAARLRAELVHINENGMAVELSSLEQTAIQLENYADDESRLVSGLATFNSDITNLATKLSTLSTQPLELDLIQVAGSGAETPAEDVSFWTSLKIEFLRFFNSFFSDYGAIEKADNGSDAIDVWVMIGRDQAQIIRNMISDSFTPSTGIKVTLSLASAGFNEAVMSGAGPDVCVGTERVNIINLGVRETLCDLTRFEGFEALKKRFQKTAFNGYTYEGQVFGMPISQEFNVMYIRTDIYEELGLKPPQTWDQLREQVAILGRYNMQAGVTNPFSTMLLQNGMTYYTDDLRSTVLGTVEAYNIYKESSSFHTDYEVPISYNATNRFRTGEMPIHISAFSFFNTFTLLAPELNGKWAMYPIPGTMQEDGTINRSTEAVGSACVILKDTDSPQAAFDFLDWFTNAESQARFCREIEDVLGPSGRFATANVEAFETTNWSSAQRKVLREQREWVWEMPQTPYAYIIDRNLNNLFINVVNNDAEIRESMLKYERIIQSEIDRKYEELALYKKGE